MFMRFLVFAAALLFIQSLNAELDWNITGSGARAAGMGNAFIGIADDATAINWNPGGLTALEHFEASIVCSSVFDQEEYGMTDNEGYTYTEDIKYNHLNLNFLSMAYPMDIGGKKLVLAAAYQKQLDFYSEDSWETDVSNYEYTSEGGVYTANLGASYQALPYLSVGATANIWTGGSESDEENSNETASYSFYSENKNFSGFNFALGTVFDMSAIKENIPLKIGAVIKTPFDLDYDYYSEEIFDDYYDDSYDFSDEYSYSGTVEIPLMFGIGASYRFGENFTVGIDFEKRNYAKSKFKWEDESGVTGESYMSPSEDDVNQFRLGMEYLIVTDAVVVPLRLGIFNYPTLWANTERNLYYAGYYQDGYPVYQADEDETELEQLVGFGVSLGSGLIFEKFSLDFSMSVYSYENTHTDNYVDGDWAGYETEESWTNTKASANLSAVLYLDTFMNK